MAKRPRDSESALLGAAEEQRDDRAQLVRLYGSVQEGLVEVRAGIERAMARLGEFRDDSHSVDHHRWANGPMQRFVQKDPEGIAKYCMEQWTQALSDVGHLPKSGAASLPRPDTFENTVLSSGEVLRQIHVPLAELFKSSPDQALAWVRSLRAVNPTIGYILHMDMALHSINTVRSIKTVLKKNKITLEGPVADVACGPGHATDRLVKNHVIPPGNLVVIDQDPTFSQYAEKLLARLGSGNGVNLAVVHSGAENMDQFSEVKTNLPLGTIITSMALQWIPVDTVEKIVRSMVRSLKPRGRLLSVGEAPVNVTAPTPYSIVTGGDIGYSDGPLSHKELCELFLRNGLRFIDFHIERMGMKSNRKDGKLSLDMGTKTTPEHLFPNFSDHLMITTLWEKIA